MKNTGLVFFLLLLSFPALCERFLEQALEEANANIRPCFDRIDHKKEDRALRVKMCLQSHIATSFAPICAREGELTNLSRLEQERWAAKKDKQILAVSEAMVEIREEAVLEKEYIEEEFFKADIAEALLVTIPILVTSAPFPAGKLGMAALGKLKGLGGGGGGGFIPQTVKNFFTGAGNKVKQGYEAIPENIKTNVSNGSNMVSKGSKIARRVGGRVGGQATARTATGGTAGGAAGTALGGATVGVIHRGVEAERQMREKGQRLTRHPIRESYLRIVADTEDLCQIE